MWSALLSFVRNLVRVAPLLAVCLGALHAATLERLSLSDMIAQSTAIVQGTVSGSYTAYRGTVIYTHFKVNVAQQWKGATQSTADVMVPGGVVNGVRQTYPGAPQLTTGQPYVLFLWTSSTGATYTIGFTQGVFSLAKDAASGQTIAVRAPTSETILDPKTGQPVKDEPIRMPLTQLSATIAAGLAQGK